MSAGCIAGRAILIRECLTAGSMHLKVLQTLTDGRAESLMLPSGTELKRLFHAAAGSSRQPGAQPRRQIAKHCRSPRPAATDELVTGI